MILDIQQNGGASGVFHGMSEEDLQTFLRHPNTMAASDSGIRSFNEGVPHPRGYGNNPRILARYVRELKVLRLEDAIRKMSSLPANTFHFNGRGELREGNWADIVLFDPEKVQDEAKYNDPHHYPKGIPYVLVNGIVVIDNGKHTGAKAGQALRHLRPLLRSCNHRTSITKPGHAGSVQDPGLRKAGFVQTLHDIDSVIAERQHRAVPVRRVAVVLGRQQMNERAVDDNRPFTRIRIEHQRNGEQQNTARPQNTEDLGERSTIIGYVLEHLGRSANVEARCGKRKALYVFDADTPDLGAWNRAGDVLGGHE
jgi:hypothetical protein